MTELIKMTIEQARASLDKKEFSAEELLKAHIDAIEANDSLNIYISKTYEIGFEQAKISQQKINSGQAGLLEAIPVAIKDLFCTKNIRTTAGSKILSDFIPPYESKVTANLFAQGAIMTGKTNMDEFAMGSANTYSYFGNVINPLKAYNSNEDLTPGGSSGGSAAAVAAYTSMASLGSDTGGSIRQPASFCGLVGIKPTYGRCSRFGMVAFSSSLDQASVLARNVKDGAIVLQSIMGFDQNDATSSRKEVPDLYNICKEISLDNIKIGIPNEYKLDNLSEEIQRMWDNSIKILESMGAKLVDISLAHTKYALPTYYVIAPAEASSNLSRYDGVRYGFRSTKIQDSLDEFYSNTRGEGFGSEVKRRIMIGTYVLSTGNYEAHYLQAQKIRRLIANDFEEAFKDIDIIITPTTVSEAFALNKNLTPIEMYNNDIFTIPASLAGLPCMSIPAAISKNGLPLGMQLIANKFDELTMFKIAYMLERSIGVVKNV